MARPVVIKLGSSTLVDARGRLRRSRLDRIAGEIGTLAADAPICVVSSGAIALGLGRLGRIDRPGTVAELQAAAAVGQAVLQQSWQRALGRSGRATGQVLLAAGDFERRETYLNARHTLETLLAWGVTPIVNENDSTATQEITFGDNDSLAAQVAVLIGARLLVLLTDQEGLYTRDPRHPDAALVREVPDASVLDGIDTAAAGSGWGSGGMRSKVLAAEMARAGGAACVIANGGRSGAIAAAVAGESIGTRFPAKGSAPSAYKLWLRHALPMSGRIEVDGGARRALERDGASLLPVGIKAVSGRFAAGDGVELVDGDGAVFARGIAEMGTAELKRQLGRRGADPAVHRDRLVLL
ncbi:MAG: glutamate 5-kinase [Gaiellales bacterium]